MNFYQRQHAFYCGVDLHARTLYLCILNQQGDKVLHREVDAAPDGWHVPERSEGRGCFATPITSFWACHRCHRWHVPR